MDIIILMLATWRIANLLASPTEAGPYNILGRFRDMVGVEIDQDGIPYGMNEFAKGLICIWCNSVWIGMGFSALYWCAGDIAVILALPFTLSGGAIIVGEVLAWQGQKQ